MQPEMPSYQRLYLDGSSQPPVLTSSCVLEGVGLSDYASGFLRASRAERSFGMVRHLYKYRALNLDDPKSVSQARSLLVKEEVWFAAASSFNDVLEMEFDIKVSSSKHTMSRAVDELSPLLKQRTLTPAKRLLLMQKMRGMKPHLTVDGEKSLRRDIDRSIGICCMSADPRSQLLWAHYAEKNLGFSVQIAAYNDPLFVLANQVSYTDKTIVLELLKKGEDRAQSHLYKTTAWAYEKEWRIALLGVQGLVRLEKNAVTGVIFGSRASKETINTILAMNEERKTRGLNPLRAFQVEVARGIPRFKLVSL